MKTRRSGKTCNETAGMSGKEGDGQGSPDGFVGGLVCQLVLNQQTNQPSNQQTNQPSNQPTAYPFPKKAENKMKGLKQQLSKRERQRWEAEVVWFRVRYAEPGGVERSIRLLSGRGAAGRVALRYEAGEPGGVSRLYLGLPALYAPLLWQMGEDLRFALSDALEVSDEPTLLAAGAGLDWKRPFTAHIVEGSLFVSGTGGGESSYFPSPNGTRAKGWRLPQAPPVGLGLAADWPETTAPPELLPVAGDNRRWLLGWNRAGQMLAAPGLVNLYGTAAADWLVASLTQTIAAEPRGLVILDGKGDLGPRLKRKPAVTRLLGRGAAGGLTYLDMEGATVIDGFDPLAALVGESEAERRRRRQEWFRQMGVHRSGLSLLRDAPLSDVAGLQKWLAAPARQRQGAGAKALEGALGRLMADRQARQWLEWPANRFEGLPEGALIFCCRSQGWAGRQLLLAALLAALAMPGVRLVLHGLPGEMLRELAEELEVERELEEEEREREREDEDEDEEQEGERDGGGGQVMLLSNGPLLPGSLPVLTATEPKRATALAERFLAADPVLTDNLHLLPLGEGLVCHESGLHHVKF
jgi:hypothetical protein